MEKSNKPEIIDDSVATMQQVRDLLFGAQIKEMEVKIARQEEMLKSLVSNTDDVLSNRIDSIESFVKSSMASVHSKMKEELADRDETLKIVRKEQTDDLSKMSQELRNSIEENGRCIAKISAALDTLERDMRELLLEESNALSQMIQEKYKDSLEIISRAASQIREDMVHKNVLANMFTEMSLRLTNQWDDETKTNG